MPEVLAHFTDVLTAGGVRYHARAVGARMADGMWQGWIEFLPLDGGVPIRSARETTQPNRTDAAYWATGLTSVYLEGALQRALNPAVRPPRSHDEPIFDHPAPDHHVAPTHTQDAVLDPFTVYEKDGEALLRRRLAALAGWHLVRIIEAFNLSAEPPMTLSRLPQASLIDLIARSVRSAEAPGGNPAG
jgi:hypothetical protein